MSLRRYFKPANKLPTADEQRSIKSLPCHLRSPDGKRKKIIRNWLQNHETQTLNCAIKTGPTVLPLLLLTHNNTHAQQGLQ